MHKTACVQIFGVAAGQLMTLSISTANTATTQSDKVPVIAFAKCKDCRSHTNIELKEICANIIC